MANVAINAAIIAANAAAAARRRREEEEEEQRRQDRQDDLEKSLRKAVEGGDEPGVKYILRNSDFDLMEMSGGLDLIAKKGTVEMARAAASAVDFPLDHSSSYVASSLRVAAFGASDEIKKIYNDTADGLDRRAKQRSLNDSFVSAAKKNDAVSVKQALDAGADPLSSSGEGIEESTRLRFSWKWKSAVFDVIAAHLHQHNAASDYDRKNVSSALTKAFKKSSCIGSRRKLREEITFFAQPAPKP